jgi:hypothetical protein
MVMVLQPASRTAAASRAGKRGMARMTISFILMELSIKQSSFIVLR